LCAQCHENGVNFLKNFFEKNFFKACIPDPTNNTNVICQCFDGYSGQFCELAPASASLVLLVLLALVFLLLSLWLIFVNFFEFPKNYFSVSFSIYALVAVVSIDDQNLQH